MMMKSSFMNSKWGLVMTSFVLMTNLGLCDVKSTNGQIHFDIDSAGAKEATLNSTGLGIHTVPSSNLDVNGNTIITGSLNIGTTTGQSNLNIQGSIGYSTQTVSSETTLDGTSVVMVDTSSDNVFVTLPYAGNVTGRIYTVKKTSTNNQLWVSGGGNYIDDAPSIELSNGLDFATFVSSGTQWYTLSSSDNSKQSIASDNLVAWWQLDEASGSTTVEDKSSNSYDGSIVGVNSANVGVDGVLNKAIDFYRAEASNRVNISGIDMTGWDKLSVSVWCYYRGGGTAEHAVVSNWSTGNNKAGFLIRIEPTASDRIEAYIQGEPDGTGSQVLGHFSDLLVPTNAWSHIVITYDSVLGFNCYLNNTSSSSNPLTAKGVLNSSTSGTMYIGYEWGSDWFDGLIDDVRIYNRVLSADEVGYLYQEVR